MEPLHDDGGKRLRQPTAYLVDDNGDDDDYVLLIMIIIIIIFRKNLKNWGGRCILRINIFLQKKESSKFLWEYEFL